MGFPIRKSADQRLFAPPHGLSQRTTSFIASQRQGIHRIPLRHLIALIIDAHSSAEKWHRKKDQFASNAPGNVAVKRTITCWYARLQSLRTSATGYVLSSRWMDNTRDTNAAIADKTWRETFHGRATARRRAEARTIERREKSGGARRDRTDDLMLAKHALSQLSYGPEVGEARLVGLGRLELPTSRLSSARSNQLSYKPEPLARHACEQLVLEEREAKTAVVPQDRPDWPLCSAEI